MYLRHTTRRKDGKTHVYWQLVRSVRRGYKVVQETVAQLGELDGASLAFCRTAVRKSSQPCATGGLLKHLIQRGDAASAFGDDLPA